MAGHAEKQNYKNMLYWKNIIQIIIAGINLLYCISLLVTYMWYPAGPIHDLETDKIIGEHYGVTKWHLFMFVPFNVINNWSYN